MEITQVLVNGLAKYKDWHDLTQLPNCKKWLATQPVQELMPVHVVHKEGQARHLWVFRSL